MNKPDKKLRNIRRALAVVFFIGVTLLFLDFTGTLHRWLGWMAKVQLLPAIMAANVAVVAVLAVLTLVFGRVYCSVVCPLGVMQDGIAWLGKKRKKNRYSYSGEKKWLRYPVLIVFIAAIALGFLGIADLIAPYSSYGRIAQNLFQPVYLLANNLLATIAEHFDSYAFYSRDIWIRSALVFAIAAVTFVAIAIVAWRGGRTYCNTICPVGTVLGFLSRFSWFKVYFDSDKCRHCSMCTKNCKASCIDFKGQKVDYSRCVTCGDCLASCRFGALHYGHKAEKANSRTNLTNLTNQSNQTNLTNQADQTNQANQVDQPDKGRRNFLLGAALATSSVALAQAKKKLDGGLAKIEDKQVPKRQTPVTPPGSLSAENMASHCTACQLCVAECPNDILRPSTDPEHFMQPVMSFDRGYCRPECTRCSQVCPTGAIRPITRDRKVSTHIGHAVYAHWNCVVLRDNVTCGNCARHCPTGAIDMIDFDGPNGTVQVPSVNESVCIGCGACEYVCPARPLSAIYVEGHETHRVE